MLILLILVSALLLCSLTAGYWTMQLLRCGELKLSDSVLLAGWIGFMILAVLNLAISLLFPLNTLIAAAEILLCIFIGVTNKNVRQQMASLLKATDGTTAISVMIILAMASIIGSQLIVNRDGISYQFDLIQHLSQTGSVPGLALVHSRYGYISSWFTIPALLNHGFLQNRTAMVANTVFIAMAFLHVYSLMRRIATGTGRASDYIMTPSLLIGLSLPVLINMPASPSHDVPVVLLTLITVWIICLREDLTPNGHAEIQNPIPAQLPLLLAAMALTVKLSALPVFAAAGLYYLYCRPSFADQFRTAMLICALTLPLVASSVLITGHWLYPLAPTAPVPWALGHEWAEVESQIVKNYAVWGKGTVPLHLKSTSYLSMDWLRHWLNLDTSNLLGFFGFMASMCSLPLCLLIRKQQRRLLVWPFIMGLVGIAFLLIMAPASRFGWGYLIIIPSSLIGVTFMYCLRIPAVNPKAAVSLALLLPSLLLAGNLIITTKSERRVDTAMASGNLSLGRTYLWIQPSVIPLIKFNDLEDRAYELCDHRGANDLFRTFTRPSYYSPEGRSDIELRDQSRGPRGGYQRTSEWNAPDPSLYQ